MRIGIIALALVCSSSSFAAQVTDVADAADVNDVFDANIELKVEGMWHRALITRENTQVPAEGSNQARTVMVRELDWERWRVRLLPRLEVGLFHDLAVFVEWPIVLWDQTATQYTEGTNATNSTVARDLKPNPRTIQGWPEDCGSGGNGLSGGCYGYPASPYNGWRIDDETGAYKSVRAGFDYPIAGVRWSPVNNERDPSKPTITLGTDYNFGVLPLPRADPRLAPSGDEASETAPGPVAHAVHEFHFQVAVSKRWALLDPFFVVDYTLPLAASDSLPGFFPRHKGGFTLGMEIVPYENPQLGQKLAVQISGMATYFSEGRDYGELTDALGELNYSDNYMTTGLNLGVLFKAFEYGYINLTGTVAYDSPHFVTVEDIGTDHDPEDDPGFGVVNLGLVDDAGDPIPEDQIERNVHFNPIYDTPGRRFKVEESLRIQGMAHLALTF